jgi:hypothetical protein
MPALHNVLQEHLLTFEQDPGTEAILRPAKRGAPVRESLLPASERPVGADAGLNAMREIDTPPRRLVTGVREPDTLAHPCQSARTAALRWQPRSRRCRQLLLVPSRQPATSCHNHALVKWTQHPFIGVFLKPSGQEDMVPKNTMLSNGYWETGCGLQAEAARGRSGA